MNNWTANGLLLLWAWLSMVEPVLWSIRAVDEEEAEANRRAWEDEVERQKEE